MTKTKTIKGLLPKLHKIVNSCKDTDIQIMIIAYNGKEIYTGTHGNANDISKAVSLCDNKHIKDIAKLSTIRAMIEEEGGISEDKQLNFK
jgi:hypothetical protein